MGAQRDRINAAADKAQAVYDGLSRIPILEGWLGTHDLVTARIDLVNVIRRLRRAADQPHPEDVEEVRS